MPAVSWIITVKNGMPFLPETLASIAAQTFTDYEVLVWLVEGSDDTEAELNRWIPSRLPGRIFKSANISIGAARAKLVSLSQAEFCACIDADDVNEPRRLELQVKFLRDHPEIALVGSRLRIIDDQSRANGVTFDYPLAPDEIFHGFLTTNTIGQPAVLFRRAAVLAAGNYHDHAAIEDYDLWLRLSVHHRLANLPDYLVKYRMHSTSSTRQLEGKRLLEELMVETFIDNAPSVFGLTPTEAERLYTKRDSFIIVRALKMARHLSRTQGGTIWARMRNASFIENLRSKMWRRDIVSRFGFALLDKQHGSLKREFSQIVQEFSIRDLLKRLMMMFPMGDRLVESIRARRARRRLLAWHKSLKAQGSNVSQQINFTGLADGHTKVKTDVGLFIEPEVTIWISDDQGAQPELQIGKRVSINRHVYLGVYLPIAIGDNTMIGAYSYIISANHRHESREIPMRDQGYKGAPIAIGQDVWIGTHVVILPGVTIGNGAIVGAGSVVTRDIPSFEIWGGVPARLIRKRQ